MKTRDKEDSKRNAKSSRSKPRSAVQGRSAAQGRRKSVGRIPDQEEGTPSGSSNGYVELRSAFYREETGSNDGLYEYVF